jgi:prepilin signal peptidase PulO-like enzyme (type II secretory pathway)
VSLRRVDLATGLLTGAGVVLVLLAFSALQPDAIGTGDIKLAVLIVFGLDGHAAQALLLGLGLAAAFGLLVILRRGRAAARTALPLAPFLATGSLLALLA